METEWQLKTIRFIHTLIWILFNVVIFYMLYAALINKLDIWLWAGYGLIITEGIVLVVFKSICPVTFWARRYSNSTKDNFDIYLPEWLAKNNKLIYTSIVLIVVLVTGYRLFK